MTNIIITITNTEDCNVIPSPDAALTQTNTANKRYKRKSHQHTIHHHKKIKNSVMADAYSAARTNPNSPRTNCLQHTTNKWSNTPRTPVASYRPQTTATHDICHTLTTRYTELQVTTKRTKSTQHKLKTKTHDRKYTYHDTPTGQQPTVNFH